MHADAYSRRVYLVDLNLSICRILHAAGCRSWAAGQGAQAAMFSAKCNAEVKTCINRCKGGNKVFIGVSQGLAYPISECK
jgi:hypothetical protein